MPVERTCTVAPTTHSTGSLDAPAAVALLPDRRRLASRVALVALVLAAFALAVAALPGLGEVRDRLAGASLHWLALVLVLQIASCMSFVVAFRAIFCRRMPWRLSYDVGIAVQGTNVLLPSGGAGGLAVAAWALTRAGIASEVVVRRGVAMWLLTSAVNFAAAVLAGGLLAVGILAGGGSLALTAGPAIGAALAIAGVLALPRALSSARATRPRAGRAGRVIAWLRSALHGGIRDAIALGRSRNPAVVGGSIGFMVFDVAALGAAFVAIGQLPPLGALLIAYVIGQLGGLIPVPGGVGGADGGLIAALVLYGTPLSSAAAAVLAFRAFQLGVPALLGGLALARLPGVVERAPDLGEPAAGAPRASAGVLRHGPCRSADVGASRAGRVLA
ncbi:MAG: lysylphosphatidylglycerol synthase domain-containing protein [Solirubrobacteraceae bacterium]